MSCVPLSTLDRRLEEHSCATNRRSTAAWSSTTGPSTPVCSPTERHLIDTYLESSSGDARGRHRRWAHPAGDAGSAGFNESRGLRLRAASHRSSQEAGTPAGRSISALRTLASLEYPDASIRSDRLPAAGALLHRLRAEGDGSPRRQQRAYRILEPGGTALFSFLSYETRMGFARLPRRSSGYLRGSPASLTGRKRSPQGRCRGSGLPRSSTRSCLLDRGPYNYWFRTRGGLPAALARPVHGDRRAWEEGGSGAKAPFHASLPASWRRRLPAA